MTLLLASVASLSLLIGGIGIMNIMLVSVTQRTREIGVRLAVGATEWDVQLQFLSEAVALSMLGGVLGILAGALSSTAVEQFFGFPTRLTLGVLAIGGIFAASIGIIFGYYPARKGHTWIPSRVFATSDDDLNCFVDFRSEVCFSSPILATESIRRCNIATKLIDRVVSAIACLQQLQKRFLLWVRLMLILSYDLCFRSQEPD